MEAQTLNGLSVVKIYFQPDVSIDLAIAQIVSASNSIRALMPEGIQPPVVVQYNASSVPVLQLSLTSDTLDQTQLYNYGLYTLRQQLAPVQGVTFPTPDGGKPRQIMVDIDPKKLLAKGMTPMDVVNAVNAQNLTIPSGLMKIGKTEYTVRTNSMPGSIEELNNMPIKYVDNQTVFVRDVGQVRDGSRQIDFAHSSRADCADDLAVGQHLSRSERVAAHRPIRRGVTRVGRTHALGVNVFGFFWLDREFAGDEFERGSFNKTDVRVVVSEERGDLVIQVAVAITGIDEK
jgi:multidrug efflux pump subunit AcrB